MRRAIVPCAILLALVTGAVLGQARSVFTPVVRLDTAVVDANVELIRRFYETANQTIETGDFAAIDRIVAEDYLEHAVRPGVDLTREGLVRYLRSVHATSPALRLAVLDVVAQHDRVVAHVRVESTSGDFLGLPVASGGVWGAIDVFRIQHHRIVEHWGDQESRLVLEPLAAAAISLTGSPWKVVTVERRTYAPDATERAMAVDGPTLLWIEAGRLTVEVDHRSTAAAVVQGDIAHGFDPGRTVPPGGRVVLGAGDAIAVPPAVPFIIRNDDREPTVVIAVTIRLPAALSAMIGVSGSASEGPGITTEVLAGGSAILTPTGSQTLALGQATLAPGADLAGPGTQGTVVVAVEVGRLTLTVPEGDAWLRTDGHRSVTARTYQELPAGQSAMVAPGAVAAYRNDGSGPLVVLMVTLMPESAGSDSSSLLQR